MACLKSSRFSFISASNEYLLNQLCNWYFKLAFLWVQLRNLILNCSSNMHFILLLPCVLRRCFVGRVFLSGIFCNNAFDLGILSPWKPFFLKYWITVLCTIMVSIFILYVNTFSLVLNPCLSSDWSCESNQFGNV